MLVLNRKVGESITIDGQIKIKILGDSGVIRVGIDAPKHMTIVRDELIGKYKDKPHLNFSKNESK